MANRAIINTSTYNRSHSQVFLAGSEGLARCVNTARSKPSEQARHSTPVLHCPLQNARKGLV
jgi:hypothetical protein